MYISKLSDIEFDKYCKNAIKYFKEKESQIEIKEFEYFKFTGPLRPSIRTTRIPIKDIPGPEYADTGIPIREELSKQSGIIIYSQEDIKKIRHVSMIGREVLDIVSKYLKVGVTGNDIDKIIIYFCIQNKVYPSPLNYYGFPKSYCISINEVICHGIPDQRPVEDGDIVNIDISIYANGFHTDLNETFMIGNVDNESKNLIKTAYESLAVAAKLIKPGTFYRDIGNEITKIANKRHCAVVKDYCGHGVGQHFHCLPNIPHYSKNKAIGIMRPGHIFTIEPMLNSGSDYGCITWPDKWTVTTRNGKRSAQFEHTFLVTETGCEILTAHPDESRTEMLWSESLEKRLTK